MARITTAKHPEVRSVYFRPGRLFKHPGKTDSLFSKNFTIHSTGMVRFLVAGGKKTVMMELLIL